MMERMSTLASHGPVLTSCTPRVSKQRNGARCSFGIKIKTAVPKSCWLGEERRWQPALRTRRFVNVKQMQVTAGLVDEVLNNQVLVSGSLAGILGQIAKPFASALSGQGFNWKLIFKPGGMPSTHSATVTAVATAVGLERGLSDPLFGVAFIMASLVMYDAQGVRRAVGLHAEVLNTMVLANRADSVASSAPQSTPNPSPYAIGVELARDPVEAELAFMEESKVSASQGSKGTVVLSKESPVKVNGTPSIPIVGEYAEEQSQSNSNSSLAKRRLLLENADKLPSVKRGEVIAQEFGSLDGWRHIPLKESVGHTKLEVFVGALWGILIAVALHPNTH